MSRKRLNAVLGAITVLALIVSPLAVAEAHRRGRARSVPSFVEIDRVTDSGRVEGRVTSVRPACREGRIVRVLRNGEVEASAVADRSGFWVAFFDGEDDEPGDFFIAQIERFRPARRPIRCSADTDISTFNGSGEGDAAFLFVGVAGAGRVDSEPDDGINNCREDSAAESGDCFEEYPRGTTTTLRATPDEGETFEGWGEDCESRGTNPTCTLTMTEQREATATFSGGGGNEPDDCPVDPSVPAQLRDVLCLIIATLRGLQP